MQNITVVDLNANLEPSEPVEKQEEPIVIETKPETQVEAPKAKKPRAPRKKKIAEPDPEPVIEIDSTMAIKKIEPVVEVEQPQELDKPVEKSNIKTVELVECPNCNKKLTQRTLKYSHQSVCPAMKPAKPEKVEQVNQEPNIIRKSIRTCARTEKYKNLVAHAF
jgi:hypothetical protein